jgi:hypothetical protein
VDHNLVAQRTAFTPLFESKATYLLTATFRKESLKIAIKEHDLRIAYSNTKVNITDFIKQNALIVRNLKSSYILISQINYHAG